MDIKYPLKYFSINYPKNFTVLKLYSVYSAESMRTSKKHDKLWTSDVCIREV